MSADTSAAPATRSLWGRLVDLFSSITFGVILLTLLFIYSSIGSSGVPMSWRILDPAVWHSVRELPMFEMTEFEWFHWWPFDVLIALITLTLVVTTVRRIPFRPVNYGVWMIHSGLIIMGIGCVMYFSTKIEGDAVVIRRAVNITLPDGTTGSMPAIPGNFLELEGENGPTSFFVQEVNPRWPILSGDDEGKEAYSVTVAVQQPGRSFQRQMLAGYPEYTEDIMRSGNPAQPFQRAVKVIGEKLLDDELSVTLDYAPTTDFYVAHHLTKAWALYLREKGTTEWIERKLDGVPLFNDHIASLDDVHTAPGQKRPPLRPLDVIAPASDPRDPLADVEIGISRYLRYARMNSQWGGGGEMLFPYAEVRMENEVGASLEHELTAFDPTTAVSRDGLVQFRWAETENDLLDMDQPVMPALRIEVLETGRVDEVSITDFSRSNPDSPWIPIPDTEYEYRVETVQDDMRITDTTVSVAMLEIRKGDKTWQRWAFDHTFPNRDLDAGQHGDEIALDTAITFRYIPGNRLAPLTLVAGPQERDLSMIFQIDEDEPKVVDVKIGEPIDLRGGIKVTVTSYIPRAKVVERPMIVPPAQRNRDAGLTFAMVRADVMIPGATQSEWVTFHQYPIETRNDTLRRFWLEPVTVRAADGREIEMILSRQRMTLPEPVVLDDFEIKSHVGGFSGKVSSIADWISQVRFDEGSGVLSESKSVSMNKPASHHGLFYFQAQWDPPQESRGSGDPPSQGLNYTVLGVGNGRGRITMLLGVIISVIGMIYAFYYKPIIKRRLVAAARARAATAAN